MIKRKYFVVTMIIFMVTKQTPLNCTFVLTVVLKMTPTKVVIQKYCFFILSIYFYLYPRAGKVNLLSIVGHNVVSSRVSSKIFLSDRGGIFEIDFAFGSNKTTVIYRLNNCNVLKSS